MIARTTGERPLGWYCRYGPSENTRRLLVEEGGFLYDFDAYNDELPYWVDVGGKPHLVVPYTMDANDGKFAAAAGFGSSSDFEIYLKATFDQLYEEGGDNARADVGRPASAHSWPAGARPRSGRGSRSHPEARPRLGLPSDRRRAALASAHPFA